MLLAHPDAVALPVEQITGGRTIVAESARQLSRSAMTGAVRRPRLAVSRGKLP